MPVPFEAVQMLLWFDWQDRLPMEYQPGVSLRKSSEGL
jgi:hypothetical protein